MTLRLKFKKTAFIDFKRLEVYLSLSFEIVGFLKIHFIKNVKNLHNFRYNIKKYRRFLYTRSCIIYGEQIQYVFIRH